MYMVFNRCKLRIEIIIVRMYVNSICILRTLTHIVYNSLHRKQIKMRLQFCLVVYAGFTVQYGKVHT